MRARNAFRLWGGAGAGVGLKVVQGRHRRLSRAL